MTEKAAKEHRPTKHALEKMELRNILWGETLDVIEKPTLTYGPDHKGRTVMQKDKLSVVVGSDLAVVTVLLRQDGDWTDEDVRQR